MKKLRIAELHHEAVPFWAQYANACQSPVPVLSLDYHTDTLSCLRRNANFPLNAAKAAEAAAFLHHDEHFDWALRAGILSRAVIISHTREVNATAHEKICVVRDESWPEMNELLNAPAVYRPLADQVLESAFLQKRLTEAAFDPFQEQHFILDVDLDFLLTRKAFSPGDARLWQRLIAHAGLVTVSQERDWVRILALDADLPDAETQLFSTIP